MRVVADQNIPFIKEAFSDFEIIALLSGRDITNDVLRDADILLVRSITKVNESLLKNSSVKFVATATIGFDHIDVDYLQRNNIGFASAPGSNADSVADYITSSLNMLSHKLDFKLSEKTLGIIGVGNVGSRVKRRADILGMKTLLCDPPKKRETKDNIYIPQDEVLKKADIVTVHVPLNKEGLDPTYKLINKDFISKMKKGSILFNTSRGNVMDEKEVRDAKGYLSEIILDVWENEPTINIETLNKTFIGTPHIAGYSYDGKVNGTQMIYNAACDYFGLPKKWNKTNFVKPEKELLLDLSSSNDLLFDAINGAYTILNDNQEMKKIVDVAPEGQGKYFDDLRKNYPRRREFFNYSVITAHNADKTALAKVKALGFKIR